MYRLLSRRKTVVSTDTALHYQCSSELMLFKCQLCPIQRLKQKIRLKTVNKTKAALLDWEMNVLYNQLLIRNVILSIEEKYRGQKSEKQNRRH